MRELVFIYTYDQYAFVHLSLRIDPIYSQVCLLYGNFDGPTRHILFTTIVNKCVNRLVVAKAEQFIMSNTPSVRVGLPATVILSSP